jgi:hypothetical protein
MLYSDVVERHRKYRIFAGRLAELQFAQWLESQGWEISGLEALREGPDVEGRASGRPDTAFEVKVIGTEDNDFRTMVASLTGEPSGRTNLV